MEWGLLWGRDWYQVRWAIYQVEAWGRGLVRSIRGRGLCCGLSWVLTICGSVATPLLKVVVNVEAQASLYQGT